MVSGYLRGFHTGLEFCVIRSIVAQEGHSSTFGPISIFEWKILFGFGVSLQFSTCADFFDTVNCGPSRAFWTFSARCDLGFEWEILFGFGVSSRFFTNPEFSAISRLIFILIPAGKW